MFYVNNQYSYPPQLIDEARVAAIRSLKKKTTLLISFYVFIVACFIGFGAQTLRSYILTKRPFSLVSFVLNVVFLLYSLYCIFNVLKERRKKIAWFKSPSTDPYFIINGIYPKEDINIATFYQPHREQPLVRA
ncbi:hypothetical protein BB560_002315 [Smittium megazygosporum]|uniref:Uncharacterized protein n=1 Tax=Smittium megazygosporum TaxID=133381 RepID=A0A2T9ZF77_9FUNG|nr:hypothetical protein BB560_002315 [Smittium megazygosporum]